MNLLLKAVFLGGVFLTSVGAGNAFAEETPAWFSCSTDSDCVIAGTGCSRHAVNTASAVEADAYYTKLDREIGCPAEKSTMPLKTACLHQKTACKRTKFFGLVTEDDPASTCISAEKTCVAIPAATSP